MPDLSDDGLAVNEGPPDYDPADDLRAALSQRERELKEARAEVYRLREERRGMVAESSWDELADEMTEVEADNARLRAAIREHDRRYTLDGGGRARCYPVMGELLPGDDDE